MQGGRHSDTALKGAHSFVALNVFYLLAFNVFCIYLFLKTRILTYFIFGLNVRNNYDAHLVVGGPCAPNCRRRQLRRKGATRVFVWGPGSAGSDLSTILYVHTIIVYLYTQKTSFQQFRQHSKDFRATGLWVAALLSLTTGAVWV